LINGRVRFRDVIDGVLHAVLQHLVRRAVRPAEGRGALADASRRRAALDGRAAGVGGGRGGGGGGSQRAERPVADARRRRSGG
jgi:hypothetical protein